MTAIAHAIDRAVVEGSLEARGFANLPRLLSPQQCESLAAMYSDDGRFRARIDMARFRFGSGEYQYFANPLPDLINELRHDLYEQFAPIANAWASRLRSSRPRVPATLDGFLQMCHAAGQRRPTPLLLSYTTGGHNCLHQDIYGDVAFPLQVVVGLSRPGHDYEGGESLFVEQRPRAQSRGFAVRVEQGEGIVFATRERPVAGSRGDYRVVLRHGVSTITSGSRIALGIIFHDAK
ncbi:MAG TPA: 2OG-Fe(II) oxygenase [Vicinamibacterales bacterium]